MDGFPAAEIRGYLHRTASAGPYPPALDQILSAAMMDAAQAEISTWPGYAPTPLRRLDRMERALGLRALWYKDEGERFGLGSFKALGGAYAVLRLAQRRLGATAGAEPPLSEIRSGAHANALADLTVVSATDGNHGRSVAWGARMAGCRCRIYIHAGVSAGRAQALSDLGAEVVRCDGDYDDSVRQCAREAAENGWEIVSDTSFEGYVDLPRTVMAGYTVMAGEALDQIAAAGEAAPTHLVVQAGVGGVAAAVLALAWRRMGPARPRLIVVEPERAACLMESARQGRAASVAIDEETVMAGLSCGEASLIAWEILARGADDFVLIGERGVGPMMRALAEGQAGGGEIVAGESAVPGLIALSGLMGAKDLARGCGLGPDSRVLCFGCEGATDPEIYRRMIAAGAAEPEVPA